jgi:hypothetical protein
VIAEMTGPEAKKWMKKCVDSGLWVPKDTDMFEEEEEGDADDDAPEAVAAPTAEVARYSEDDLSPID